MAVDCVGVQTVDHYSRMFQLSTHDFNVSSSYTQPVVYALNRTGHARFRRGPSTSSRSEDKPQDSTSMESTSTSSSSVVSSSAAGGSEGSVSNRKQLSSLGIVAPAPTFSSRKPPLPSSHRKRCSGDVSAASLHRSGSEIRSASRTGCHCCNCKRRKTGLKGEGRRVGCKVTGIPADDYSWKKYGQKRIDGSRYPRVYYKCTTGKGCPAMKRVELATDGSKMVVVTYEGEHRHHHAPTPLPTTLTSVKVRENTYACGPNPLCTIFYAQPRIRKQT